MLLRKWLWDGEEAGVYPAILPACCVSMEAKVKQRRRGCAGWEIG